MDKYFRMYKSQLNNCKGRTDRNGNPIEMKLTFEEWMSVWEESGRLSERGKGKGKYCMMRKDDLGHYEVGNVFIGLYEDNISSANRNATRDNSHLCTPEVVAKRKQTMERVNASPETKKRRSESAKARAVPKEVKKERFFKSYKPKYKWVTPLGSFKSAREAAEAHGVKRLDRKFESPNYPDFYKVFA